ncbi:hypothetical protein BDV93DRAFT_334695 [Ceratobasidium sp. AG-I]|nr:hypothetical protein BDV93DRAFT_334695 [Ceratobasidium sp. AG-I]
MPLPIELLWQVTEHLRHDKKSLALLCRLNKSTYPFVAPILYGRVDLLSSLEIKSFCDAVSTGPRKLGTYVHYLKIGVLCASIRVVQTPLHEGLLDSFRNALTCFPNLRDLALMINEEMFGLCFQNLFLPFRLDKLEMPCLSSSLFYDFLHTQSAITSLHLLFNRGVHQKLGELGSFFYSDPKVLPRLNNIAAPCTDTRAYLSRAAPL